MLLHKLCITLLIIACSLVVQTRMQSMQTMRDDYDDPIDRLYYCSSSVARGLDVPEFRRFSRRLFAAVKPITDTEEEL